MCVQRLLAASAACLEHVQADPGNDGRQPPSQVLDLARVRAAQAQPGLLDRVLGVAERAEHPVGNCPQAAPVFLEALGQPLDVVRVIVLRLGTLLSFLPPCVQWNDRARHGNVTGGRPGVSSLSDLVISQVPSGGFDPQGCLILRWVSHLYIDAFSGYPFRTTPRSTVAGLPCAYPWQDSWYTGGSSIPVLSYEEQLLSSNQRPWQIGTELSRDVLNRASRTALIGEQPNPWDLLQPQDAMSRHRSAKPCRRCRLLGKMSLKSMIPPA